MTSRTVRVNGTGRRYIWFRCCLFRCAADNIRKADPATYAQIASNFAHWDDIDGTFTANALGLRDMALRVCRQRLLQLLHTRVESLGWLSFETTVDDLETRVGDVIVAADGLNSRLREDVAAALKPSIDARPIDSHGWAPNGNFITFYFMENEHGLWRVHAYNFEDGRARSLLRQPRRRGVHRACLRRLKLRQQLIAKRFFEMSLKGTHC